MSDVMMYRPEQGREEDLPVRFGPEDAGSAVRFHRMLSLYEPTPLVRLKALADHTGVREILVKDESGRFGLNAFKGLGGTYAMFRIICQELGLDPEATTFEELQKDAYQSRIREMTFVTCTDGNHGKGVSRAAGLFGARAEVLMPAGTVQERVDAVLQAGPAGVRVTDGNYDETVDYAHRLSEEHGWIFIQDTSAEGYEEIPSWIVQGYLTMAEEACNQMQEQNLKPTHVFLQAGVGAMAGGVTAYMAYRYGDQKPIISMVEPSNVNCLYENAQRDQDSLYTIPGIQETIMAGLNCGTPCGVTWPYIRKFADYYLGIGDSAAEEAMRTYAHPFGDDPAVVSGGSGAASMGAFLALSESQKKEMGIGPDSVIFMISTEGATDTEHYRSVVEK